jgi:hypothetical protein
VLKLVVVWYLAGDDVEMSSEGHENRKLRGVQGGGRSASPRKALEGDPTVPRAFAVDGSC